MKSIISKRIFLFLLVALASSFAFRISFAQSRNNLIAHQIFDQANAAYKEAKFDLAIEGYEKILKLGLESGNIYYNLGNSYFKKQEFGRAILNYERARRFIPNDSDLRSNYDYALSMLNLEPGSFGSSFEKSVNRLFEGVTVDFLAVLLSVLYVLVVIAFILNLFISGIKKLTGSFIFVLMIVFILGFVSFRSKTKYFETGAVVISKEAEVRFEPSDGATTYFKLTEGSKIEVVEKARNWYKIQRPDGKLGWVNKANLEGLI